MSRIVSAEIARLIQQRAAGKCEYCLRPELLSFISYEVDHIVARSHGGHDGLENLCWACISCNARKGPNLSSMDWETSSVTDLFHPRRHAWSDHFELAEGVVLSRTSIGRVSVSLLKMNTDAAVQSRKQFYRVYPTPFTSR